MKEYLFSYGTLQKTEVQLKLFGRVLHGMKDTLEHYKISLIEIKDETFLSKGEQSIQQTVIPSIDINDKIEGTVFEISTNELLMADKYEPNNYKRIQVILRSGKTAWLYVADENSE